MKRVGKVVSASLILLLVSGVLLAGCGPAAPEGVEPIIIGNPTDLGLPNGKQCHAGVMLAADEINAKGGVNFGGVMRPIKVEATDSRGMAPGTPVSEALMAYEKLILEKEPDALVGVSCRSEVVIASMELMKKYKLIQMVDCALSLKVTDLVAEDYESYKYTFRTTYTAAYLGALLAQQHDVLKEKFGLNKAFIIHEDALWAHGTMAVMTKLLTDAGWEVVGHEVTPLGTTDFSAALLKAKDAGAQAIPVAYSLPEVLILARQWYDMKIPALVTGFPCYIVSPKALEVLGEKVNWMITSAGELGTVGSAAYPKSAEFNKKFAAKFYELYEGYLEGDHPSGSNYDALYILVDAIERTGSLDPEILIPALEATDWLGANGRIRFDENHTAIYGMDPNEGGCGITVQWQDGKMVPVLPEAVADGEFQLPPWMK